MKALSPEHREALDSSIDEAIDHYLANYGELLEKWDSVLEEKGVTKVELASRRGELAAFRKAAADPIREKWIADMTAQGLPAQELYDLVHGNDSRLSAAATDLAVSVRLWAGRRCPTPGLLPGGKFASPPTRGVLPWQGGASSAGGWAQPAQPVWTGRF